MKIGVIDVGGGTRGSYGAGVFDYCMNNHITFNYGIGVSAGAANLSSLWGGQQGRNYKFYTEYYKRKSYMSFHNLLKTGSYIGLEYIYGDLSDSWGEYPLNYEKMMQYPAPMYIVCTDGLTGQPRYFSKEEMSQDCYDPIKASCCVPVINKPWMIDDTPYYDGGISDPVPLKKAFADGCDKLVLVLTRPKEYRRIPKNDGIFADMLEKTYPGASDAMRTRSYVYNACVDEAEALEKQGKVLIIAPDDIGEMKTLTKDDQAIKNLYVKGYLDAAKISEFVKK